MTDPTTAKRCRNCGAPATGRKMQYCGPACRFAVKARRAAWAVKVKPADDPSAHVVAVTVVHFHGTERHVRLHRISTPPTAFDRFVLQQLEHWRDQLRNEAGPRPGKR